MVGGRCEILQLRAWGYHLRRSAPLTTSDAPRHGLAPTAGEWVGPVTASSSLGAMTAAVSPFAEPIAGTLPGASAVAAAPGIGRRVLPAPLRPSASLCVLDITEFYGPTSGGVRTYLHAKAAYVDARPDLAQVIVVPGARDTITDSSGARRYLLSGPRVPRQPQYRFLLATRSNRRIVQHERPDLIEIGSPGFVPWQVQWAARDLAIPRVAFFHSNFPRIFVPFPERSGWGGQLLSRAAWRYVRWLDRSVATTIVSSRFAAEDLARAGVDRVEQIPLGVEYTHFHPGRRGRRAAIRRAHGLDTERPLALTISRFAAEKELHVLIAGWAEVHRRTGAQLLLIGDGTERHTGPFGASRRRGRAGGGVRGGSACCGVRSTVARGVGHRTLARRPRLPRYARAALCGGASRLVSDLRSDLRALSAGAG